MKTVPWMVTVLACLAMLLSGCAAKAPHGGGASFALSESLADSAYRDSETAERPDSMLIWSAYLNISVRDVPEGMEQASAVAKRFKGYVEEKSANGERSASVKLRIPAATFKEAIGALEGIGKVEYRSVSSEDVTEQYIDVEARLKNKKELRDRLRRLLEKATDVKDILAIETELNRVQSDIDAMEGKIRHLKGQVDFATIDLRLEREKILGPLGYIFKGLWWGIEKLFVIRN